MNLKELTAAIIPALTTFCGSPIIMADDMGEKPNGPHATYKITTKFGKGVGRAEETFEQSADGLKIKRVEEYKAIFSFTAYAMDDDESMDLAQQIYDWFAFDGYEFLDQFGIVIADQTDVINRDAFIVENYERRNGFDVIFRIIRKTTHDVDWFDKVQTNNIVISGEI
jgi:hypothetical protein